MLSSAALLVSRSASNMPGGLLLNTFAHALLPIWNALLYGPTLQLVANSGRQALTLPSRWDRPPLLYGLTARCTFLPSPYHDFSFLGSHDWGPTLSLFCPPLVPRSFAHSKRRIFVDEWMTDRKSMNSQFLIEFRMEEISSTNILM